MTRADIVAGLREVGLQPGDLVQVHSSLSSFGYVEGGAEAVVDALLEAVGPEGTVMVPTFNHMARRAFDDDEQIFDPRTTRSISGAITEALRLRPGAHRSLHPTHPYAAIGPRAAWLTSEHLELKTFDERSPLGKLVAEGGKIVLLGVGMNSNTAAHVAETKANAPCMGYRQNRRLVRLEDGTVIEAWSVVWRGPGKCKIEWQAIEGELRRRGLIRDTRIGEAHVMLMLGRDMVDVTYELCLQMCSTCPIRPRYE
ncbi:MAG: AAC(3) family N-acetyltransferase [Armatimonadota bacterium]